MFLFHDGLAQFFVLVGLSGSPGGLWQFFVGAVEVTGNDFVELARLIFLFRVELTHQFLLALLFRRQGEIIY
jgi:hypothetical protein